MASIINASNSTGLTLTSDLSGVLQFQQNGVALPALSVAPTFSAYASAAQTVTSGVNTKVTFDTELFDTNNNFDSTTNYRFTPTVAGYYQLNTIVRFNGTSPSQYQLNWYKNGSNAGSSYLLNANNGNIIVSASTLLYLNGTTDYVEVYATFTATSPTLGAGSGNLNTNYFSGCLVRGA